MQKKLFSFLRETKYMILLNTVSELKFDEKKITNTGCSNLLVKFIYSIMLFCRQHTEMKKRVPKKQAFHHHHCLLVTHEESFSELINTRLIDGGHHQRTDSCTHSQHKHNNKYQTCI